MEISYDCPLGGKCERRIDDDSIVRCGWFTKMAGQDETGKDIEEWRCAMAWMPLLMLEASKTNRGQTAALESFRNDMVDGQRNFTQAILTAATAKKLA